MPSKNYCGLNQMKSAEREQFLKWYEVCVSENYVFDFQKDLVEYCRSDVDTEVINYEIQRRFY